MIIQADVTEFHAHVYYARETRESAVALRDGLAQLAGGKLSLSQPSDGPRGPHVNPMFGVDVPAAALAETLAWLMLRHGPHAVLIHPVTSNELMDHTHHALWLGPPQPLDLSRLV